MEQEKYMSQALSLAQEAAEHGETPVGCIIVNEDGRIVGRGRNRRIENADATAHAEIEAIREACAALGDWRLENCAIFVTLEPCPMCAGAIINARIPKVYYGAREENSGACGSVIDLFFERFGHSPAVYPGVCSQECATLLGVFFKEKRKNGINSFSE